MKMQYNTLGDTQRPLLFLLVAGAINVVLNLFFVIVMGIGVAGVAIATVLSQAVSALLVLLCLVRTESVCQVKLKRLRVTTDPATIDYGMTVMLVSGIPYFTFGMLSVILGAMRGLSASVMPMAVAIAGVCGLRLAWIWIVFPFVPTWTVVQLSYPVSWAVTLAVAGLCYGVLWRKQKSKLATQN